MKNKEKDETVKVNIMGIIKLESTNPTDKTIRIIVLLLILCVVLVVCLSKVSMFEALLHQMKAVKWLSG